MHYEIDITLKNNEYFEDCGLVCEKKASMVAQPTSLILDEIN